VSAATPRRRGSPLDDGVPTAGSGFEIGTPARERLVPDSAAAATPTLTPTPPEPVSLLPLHTPGEAARLLAVRESWLRRRATARLVPCTFLGRHLRFSHADVIAIAIAGACPTGTAVPAGRARARRATTRAGRR
jgi:hypothetical protein